MSGSYTPEFYYGMIPGTYGEMGLVPWPKHLQPREQTVELTKKGEAYVAAALAEAGGVFFLTLDQNDRASIIMTIERLINMLDAMDGDENLEAIGDEEPSLGWPEGCGLAQIDKSAPQDDREEENEHGGDISDEPHDDDELEPFLGWSETCGNGEPFGPIPGSAALMDDPEAGDGALDFRGDGCRQARGALRGRTRRTLPFTREYAERVTIMPDGQEFHTFVPIQGERL